MTLAEQAERMAERLRSSVEGFEERDDRDIRKAAALLRQCAEALRKEGV